MRTSMHLPPVYPPEKQCSNVAMNIIFVQNKKTAYIKRVWVYFLLVGHLDCCWVDLLYTREI